VSEGRFYVAGGAVAFVGLSVWVIAGWSAVGALLMAAGAIALGIATWKTRNRMLTVRVEIEDDHLHPIPVLDAPKGTFDLIAGLTVRIDNQLDEPIEVSIETLLYRRTAWKWDLPLPGSRPVPLLTSSVVPARRAKSYFVKNYTRIPDEIKELTPDHFVKLIVTRAGLGKSAHRVFVRKRFELPKESRLSGHLRPAFDEAPLLPFAGQPALSPRADSRSAAARFKSWLGGFGSGRRVEPRVHPLRESDDSLEGLIDEIEAELRDDAGRGSS
jgi:hypothetical protein